MNTLTTLALGYTKELYLKFYSPLKTFIYKIWAIPPQYNNSVEILLINKSLKIDYKKKKKKKKL